MFGHNFKLALVYFQRSSATTFRLSTVVIKDESIHWQFQVKNTKSMLQNLSNMSSVLIKTIAEQKYCLNHAFDFVTQDD